MLQRYQWVLPQQTGHHKGLAMHACLRSAAHEQVVMRNLSLGVQNGGSKDQGQVLVPDHIPKVKVCDWRIYVCTQAACDFGPQRSVIWQCRLWMRARTYAVGIGLSYFQAAARLPSIACFYPNNQHAASSMDRVPCCRRTSLRRTAGRITQNPTTST